jgi:hypothetical protein
LSSRSRFSWNIRDSCSLFVGELYAGSLGILVFSHQTWEHTCLGDLVAHFRHLQLHQSLCLLCL